MGLRVQGEVRIPDGRELFEAHMDSAAEVFPSLIRRAVESQRAPTGGRVWPARRQDYPWAPLKRTGALIGSLVVDRAGDSLSITADVPYSGFHQDTAPRRVLPARRFMPVGESFPAAWQRAVERGQAVQRAWRGGVVIEPAEVYGP